METETKGKNTNNMATNSHQETSHGGYSGAGFEAVNYDVEAIEPDAYPGEYVAKVTDAAAKMTRESNKPMIVLEWQLVSTESDEESCQRSIKSKVSDWIVLAGDRSGNQGKVKLRTLRDTLELDADIIPSTIGSFDDLKPLLRALKGREMMVWITNRVDPDGNVRTNINYTAPRGSSTMGAMATPEDDEPEAPAPKAKATKNGNGTAPKKAAKR